MPIFIGKAIILEYIAGFIPLYIRIYVEKAVLRPSFWNSARCGASFTGFVKEAL